MIKLVTDSGSAISQKEAQTLGITVIPINIIVGNQTLKDEIDISYEEVLKFMRENKEMQTSQIIPYTFTEIFNELTTNGDEVIYLSVSSKLSGTYSPAMTSLSMIDNSNKISVVDTENVLLSQNLLVRETLKLIEKGLSREDILNEIEIMKKKVEQFVIIDTLEHLYKRGRINKIQYTVGNLLQMKIIAKVKDGEIVVEDKIRGKKKAIKTTIEKLISYEIDMDRPFGICSGEDKEESLEIKSIIQQKYHKECIETRISPIVMLFSGENALGVSFFKK